MQLPAPHEGTKKSADLSVAFGKPARRFADALAWERPCPCSASAFRGRCDRSDYGYLRASILTGSPVAQDKLDVAAFVMQEDAEFLRTVIHQYGLDIVAPQDLHAQERPLGRHHRIALIGAKTGRVIFDGPWSEGAPNFLQCVSLEVARLPVMQQSVC
jgi:hypothetical protein